MTDEGVRAWSEQVVIPTYRIGAPDKNPMFLEKRVYQGSSGAVYPLPVIDKILDEKHDKIWNAVFLENRYLKIMILSTVNSINLTDPPLASTVYLSDYSQYVRGAD